MCAITNCEITSSHPDRPNEGLFVIHVILTPMGGREFDVGTVVFFHVRSRSLLMFSTNCNEFWNEVSKITILLMWSLCALFQERRCLLFTVM